MTHPRAVLATLLFTSAAGAACSMQAGTQAPSPWALTYPDSSHVSSGRIVRFAAYYGLTGPSPAFVYRDVNGSVTGQMLVWYRRFEPSQPATQSQMDADRARMDSTYGCTDWSKGYQEGPAWVCRVPPKHGTPNWAAELKRVDSLIDAQRSADPGVGRRTDPVPPSRPATNPGVTPVRPGAATCMDGGSWYIDIRDARGSRRVVSPVPGGACPAPAGPAKSYDQAGWQMLKQFIGEVR